MFKSVTANSFIIIATAAVIAGLGVFVDSIVPQVNAEPLVQPTLQSHAKGDRLPNLAREAVCAPRSWPNYAQSCQFDLRRSANDVVRNIRMIDLERRELFAVAAINEVMSAR
jgi:hypothetical protein